MKPQAIKQAWHTSQLKVKQAKTTTTTTTTLTSDLADTTLSTTLKVHDESAVTVDAVTNNFSVLACQDTRYVTPTCWHLYEPCDLITCISLMICLFVGSATTKDRLC